MLIFGAFLFVAAVGMAGILADVGSWLHAKHKLQATVDAAALAGAQELPDVGSAQTTAGSFVTANVTGGDPTPAITFPSPTGCTASCLAVDATESVSGGLFSRAISSAFGSVTVSAHSQAVSFVPDSLQKVVPVAISQGQVCEVAVCPFPIAGTLDFDSTNALLDLSDHSSSGPVDGGSASAGTMRTWISSGYPDALPLDEWYAANNSARIKRRVGSAFSDAASAGTTLVAPVFDRIDPRTGSYRVVGWAAFVIGSVRWGPGVHTLMGQFVIYLAPSPLASSNPRAGLPNYGVFTLRLEG